MVFFPLSPKLLLEIDLDKIDINAPLCSIKKEIGFSKYHDFEKLMIRNFNDTIIFPSDEKLNKLKQSRLYTDHIDYLQNN